MRDIIVTKSGVSVGAGLTLNSGGDWTISALTIGALAIMNEDGSVIDTTHTILTTDITGKTITFVTRTPSGEIKRSIPFDRSNFTYTKQAYVAPVAAVKYIGSDDVLAGTSLNLPSALSVGNTVGVMIIDKTKDPNAVGAVKEYSFVTLSGDSLTGTGASNIITKLVALINANSTSIVTAAAVDDSTDNTGISFTSKVAGNDFGIALIDGVLMNADIIEYKLVNGDYNASSTTAVANNPGQGTYAQILELEREIRVRDGYNGVVQNMGLMYAEDLMSVAGGTYTVYTIKSRAAQDELARDVNYPVELIIASPSGDTAEGKTCYVLDELLPLILT